MKVDLKSEQLKYKNESTGGIIDILIDLLFS